MGLRQDLIRFSSNGFPGENKTRRNIFGLHDSRNLVSLLRITSDSSLSNATVVRFSGGSNNTMPYFSKLHKNYAGRLKYKLNSFFLSK